MSIHPPALSAAEPTAFVSGRIRTARIASGVVVGRETIFNYSGTWKECHLKKRLKPWDAVKMEADPK